MSTDNKHVTKDQVSITQTRTLIAAMALQGLTANTDLRREQRHRLTNATESYIRENVNMAVRLADALIAKLQE